ncbi:MAG: hypothetical protein KBB94_09775 [Legionellaceae bacterium]|nr:hypothetical protein [Legionellaceae bacterium]MBP9776162.1 hypothetical protein [Legionellaceae bacterium]
MLFKKAYTWRPLAGGSFNQVYINNEATLVFKEAHSIEFSTDTPERSVRLWNLLNPNLKPEAKIATIVIDGQQVQGWTSPYVPSKHGQTLTKKELSRLTEEQRAQLVSANKRADKNVIINPKLRDIEDTEIARAQIDIYNRTGRIIVDASVPGNFMVTKSHGVVCIDIGMALLLEDKETACLDMYARRKSFVSNSTWETVHTDMHDRILKDPVGPLPKTAAITKALLFIKAYRPDIASVDFLKNTKHVEQLAQAYDTSTDTAHDTGIALLEKEQPMNLISMKKSCEKVLLNYINSRGELGENKVFKASRITQYFRNTLLTNLKIDSAQLLIKKIHAACSIEEIQKELSKASNFPILAKGHKSGFATSLGLCKIISQVTPSSPELTHTKAKMF